MVENVTNWILKSECYCLNEDVRAPHSNLFVGDSTLALQSDCDPQLLLHIAFQQTLKLSSLELGIPNNETCPQTIKLFLNKNNLGFSDASEVPPIQTITIPVGATVVKIPLSAVKWQTVDSSKF